MYRRLKFSFAARPLAGAALLSLVISAPALAGSLVPLPPANTGVGGGVGAPAIQVQSADQTFRINQLEEQMRLLNGKVEEMTFQLLQLQEQIRRMQEDNEFRFQELEQRGDISPGGNASGGGGGSGKSQPSDAGSGQASDGITGRRSIGDVLQEEGEHSSAVTGQPPGNLGTLTFDENNNLTGSDFGKPIDLLGPQSAAPEGLPDTPDGLFNLGYEYVQAGDYERAKEVFEAYASRYPDGERAPEANFWLGESLLAMGDYQASARIFLDNHKTHPQAPLAAENLMKLGVSLSGLGQRELACATFAEVPKKYPNLSNALMKRVSVEQRSAQCQSG